MKRTLFVAAVVLVVSSMLYADAPAGIHGYCYYCIEGESPNNNPVQHIYLIKTGDIPDD